MTTSLGFYSQVGRCLERDELFYQLSKRQIRIQHVGKPQSPDFYVSSNVFKKFLILHYSYNFISSTIELSVVENPYGSILVTIELKVAEKNHIIQN